MIMWVAPIGAFGAIAAVVGETGLDALKSLAVIMLGFYATCAIFVFVLLGLILKLAAGVNIFSLLRYLGREFLLIVSTSSSETALPRLIAKMEHWACPGPRWGWWCPPDTRSTWTARPSEVRAVTNFAGNAVATVLIGR